MICRLARHTGHSFERQTQEMVRKSQLARSSANNVILTDATVCNNELGNGFLDEEKNSGNEYRFRQYATKNMKLKDSSKLRKDVSKLQLWTPSHIMVGMNGLFDRLTQRYCLKNINMFELMGHQHDRQFLISLLSVDFVDYRGCEEVFDLAKDVAKRIVNSNFDLTTCKLENATYIARKNEIENKDDLEKVGLANLKQFPTPADEPYFRIIDLV